jgi:hypothetical protein
MNQGEHLVAPLWLEAEGETKLRERGHFMCFECQTSPSLLKSPILSLSLCINTCWVSYTSAGLFVPHSCVLLLRIGRAKK